MYRSNAKHEASFPINTESSNTLRVANSIKPELPPKPRLSLANKYTQNLNSVAKDPFIQIKPRPSKSKIN